MKGGAMTLRPRRKPSLPPTPPLSSLLLPPSQNPNSAIADLLRRRSAPPPPSPSSLVKAHLDRRRLDLAVAALHETLSAGLLSRPELANSLLAKLARSGRAGLCLQIFRAMKSSLISPNRYTFNVLVHAVCRSPEAGELELGALMAEMEAAGFDPDVVTYNTLISGLCRRGKTEEAMELLEKMESRGLEPDQITYSAMIVGLARRSRSRTRDSLLALQLFDKMQMREFSPGQQIYRAVISALSLQGRTREVWRMVKEMVGLGFKLDKKTCVDIVEGFRIGGRGDGLMGLVVELRRWGKVPGRVYETLIGELCRRRRPAAATTVLGMCEADGVKVKGEVRGEVVRVLVEEMVGRGEKREAERVLVEGALREKGFGVGGFNVVMEAYAGEGDVGRAMELRERMVRLGVAPNSHTCRVLIQALAGSPKAKSNDL
ncbi:uncharacterized protein LOC144702921 [Wolffia australiana]